MVSYYNPATAVAMFGRSGSGYHHHHHHSPPTQNHPYFTPGAYGAGYHHNPHSHHAGHQAAAVAGGTGGSGSPVGSGLGAPALPGGVSSTQFSPNMATDFNCNHQYNSHFSNMTPDSMAVWATQSSMYSSACAAAAARNAAAVAAAGLTSVAAPPPPPPPAPHSASFDDWSGPHHPHHLHPHAYQHHPHHPHSSFYNPHANVQQPSPPSSTPSSPSSSHSPSHNVYSASSSTPNNNSNSNNNNTSFKAEFGPCSGGNNQDATSQEIQQTNQGNPTSVSVVTSGGPSIGTPHSPDSGMAISDGVSSSGSPATNNGQQFHQTQHCLGGPSSNSSGSSSTNHSSSANPGSNNNTGSGNPGSGGSDNSQHQQQQQQQQFGPVGGTMVHGMGSNPNHHLTSNHHNPGNLNHNHHHPHHQSLVNSHHNGLINVTSSGRPTQARSPYEWMKKPAYSCSSGASNQSSNNVKTRTKDKYRVVYSDNQRLELEKEFHYSRYITIRRKSELAAGLDLSERQVKIWFQNRRAKERKVQRKRDEMLQREKLATMVHMQNAAVAAAGGMGGPNFNQPNPGVPLLM